MSRPRVTPAFRTWTAAFSLVAIFFGALIVLSACGKRNADEADLIILQTGRLRGNIYPTSLQSIAPLQHYPFLAGYVRDVREEAARTGARVLLIDLGDSLGGSFASHATDSGNMVTFFNSLRYDIIMLGNLDNNVMPSTLSEIDAVVLNPFANKENAPATTGSQFGARIDLSGIPVEVLANYYGDTNRAQYPDRFPTWFGDSTYGIQPFRDYAALIQSLGPRPNGTLSALAWMKFESPKNPPEAFLQSLRDLKVNVILAHRIYSGRERDIWAQQTFLDWSPPISENILRNNGGFTIARLDLKKVEGGWSVLKQELVPMTSNTAASDSLIVEQINQFESAIESADVTIASIDDTVSENEILVTYLTALTEFAGTQVAAYSRNSVRNNWPAGPLTASRIFNSLPWTTGIVQMDLDPNQLKKLGEIGEVILLRKVGTPQDETLTVTTSRFFASVLAERLNLPQSALRELPVNSEFDYFVTFLQQRPKPLTFETPDGWEIVAPQG